MRPVSIWLAKVARTFIAADFDAEREIGRMQDGELAEFTMVRPRNVPMFRRWWSICQSIGENQDPQRDKKSICNELKVLAGHYDILPIDGLEGCEVRVPKSIAFHNLTNDEWMALWPSLEQAGIQRFGEEFFLEVA